MWVEIQKNRWPSNSSHNIKHKSSWLSQIHTSTHLIEHHDRSRLMGWTILRYVTCAFLDKVVSSQKKLGPFLQFYISYRTWWARPSYETNHHPIYQLVPDFDLSAYLLAGQKAIPYLAAFGRRRHFARYGNTGCGVFKRGVQN